MFLNHVHILGGTGTTHQFLYPRNKQTARIRMMRRLFVSLFSGQHRCVKPSWDHETAASNISRICECLSQIISVNPICIGELLSFGLVTSRYGKKHGERFFFFAASTPSLAAFGFSNGYGYSPCLGWLMWAQESTIILPSYYHHITMSMGGDGISIIP